MMFCAPKALVEALIDEPTKAPYLVVCHNNLEPQQVYPWAVPGFLEMFEKAQSHNGIKRPPQPGDEVLGIKILELQLKDRA